MIPSRLPAKPAHILLVDDDPGDVRLTLEALHESTLHLMIDVARDGVETMAFLYRQGEHAAAPRPDLKQHLENLRRNAQRIAPQ